MKPGRIYIGTSGWVYPHWRGIFYPAKLPQRLWLEYYARHFDCTEINGSFYRLPSNSAVLHWQNSVGKEFRFCPKISRFITHAKKLNDPEQAVPRFFEVFDLIVRRSGPVLIQLPAGVAFHEEKVRNFFHYLTLYHKTFRFSLEARHLYVRFHGPDGSYASGYSKKFLIGFAARCKDWRDEGRTVWVFFNNDFKGYAVRDALALKTLIAKA